MTLIGERVRLAREAKGWSQDELADAAGVSQTTIDKIERGLTKRSRFLHYITAQLGLNPSELDPDLYPLGSPSIVKEDPDIVDQISRDKNSLMPVYSFEKIDNDGTKGVFVNLSRTPMDFINRPQFLYEESYAVYMSDGFMSPEIDPGELLIFDPRIPFIEGSTCIFIKHGSEERIIGRLAGYNKDFWTIAQWKKDVAIQLPRAEFPRLNRAAAKYYRR